MFVNASILMYHKNGKGMCVMKYYDRIREVRIQNNETQKEVARLLGTTQQASLKYEKGINDMPVKRIIALCRHYNLSADYLLGLTDIPKPLNEDEE